MPDITVSCDGKILMTAVGREPLGVVMQLSVFLALLSILFTVLVFLSLRLLGGYVCGLDANNGWLIFLIVEVFILGGIALVSWCIIHLVNAILPYSAKIDIENRMIYYGNKIWHSSHQMSGRVVLLVEPCYTKGDWGFSFRILSDRKKCLLLPSVFIGRYSNAISEARKLSEKVQKCVPFLDIQESKYWKYH